MMIVKVTDIRNIEFETGLPDPADYIDQPDIVYAIDCFMLYHGIIPKQIMIPVFSTALAYAVTGLYRWVPITTDPGGADLCA